MTSRCNNEQVDRIKRITWSFNRLMLCRFDTRGLMNLDSEPRFDCLWLLARSWCLKESLVEIIARIACVVLRMIISRSISSTFVHKSPSQYTDLICGRLQGCPDIIEVWAVVNLPNINISSFSRCIRIGLTVMICLWISSMTSNWSPCSREMLGKVSSSWRHVYPRYAFPL